MEVIAAGASWSACMTVSAGGSPRRNFVTITQRLHGMDLRDGVRLSPMKMTR